MSRAWVAVRRPRAPVGGGGGRWLRPSGLSPAQDATPAQQIWTVPEIGALPNDAYGRLVRRGRDLITATYAHIGPEVRRSREAVCRQQSRLRQLPPSGRNQEVWHSAVRTVRRISALQRALRGADHHRGPPQFLHDPQHERAAVAGARAGDAGAWWPISNFSRPACRRGQVLPGLGVGNMPELDRAADPARGETIYANACVACHGTDGTGIRRSLPTHRSRLHDAAALGQRQLQRRRRHGAADHGGKFHPLQHAAWRRLPEPAAFARSRPGTSRPM